MEKTNTAIEVQEVAAAVISSKPDDVGVLSKETKGNELEENWMTIDLAFMDSGKCQSVVKGNQEYRTLFPQLKCQQCDDLTVHGPRIVPVAEDAYYDCFAVGTCWWSADILKTFGVLKSHERHCEDVIFVDAGTPTKTHLQGRYTTTRKLPKSVATIVTVAMRQSHFVVLKIKLEPDCTTVVYDGRATRKTQGLEQWKEIEEYVLSRYGIRKETLSKKWVMRYHNNAADFKRLIKINQEDDYNCGPIACRVLWELLAPGEMDAKYYTRGVVGSVRGASVSDNVSDWRKTCIEELKVMVKKYSSDLKVKNRKKKGTEEVNDRKKPRISA